jgi:hypothetical protein
LAAFGLTLEDVATEPVEIWPEHVAAFNLFSGMSTQWRVGACGPTGLDYMVLYHRMDRLKLKPRQYAQIESDIQTMEVAALSEINRKSE